MSGFQLSRRRFLIGSTLAATGLTQAGCDAFDSWG
jgi:hypothetical protein